MSPKACRHQLALSCHHEDPKPQKSPITLPNGYPTPTKNGALRRHELEKNVRGPLGDKGASKHRKRVQNLMLRPLNPVLGGRGVKSRLKVFRAQFIQYLGERRERIVTQEKRDSEIA